MDFLHLQIAFGELNEKSNILGNLLHPEGENINVLSLLLLASLRMEHCGGPAQCRERKKHKSERMALDRKRDKECKRMVWPSAPPLLRKTPQFLAPLQAACRDIGAKLEVFQLPEGTPSRKLHAVSKPKKTLRVCRIDCEFKPLLNIVEVNKDSQEFLFTLDRDRESQETYYVQILPRSQELEVHLHFQYFASLEEYRRFRMPGCVRAAANDYELDRDAHRYRHRTRKGLYHCRCPDLSYHCLATEHPQF